eukprot:1140406-Pelagomonas_calceolata.AAC.12
MEITKMHRCLRASTSGLMNLLQGGASQPEPSVTIPGLSRYAELQELAKRKKEEQQRRQDEVRVWRKHPKGSTQLFTVPKPFHLETDQREQRPTCYSAANQEASSASSQSHSKSASAYQMAVHVIRWSWRITDEPYESACLAVARPGTIFLLVGQDACEPIKRKHSG